MAHHENQVMGGQRANPGDERQGSRLAAEYENRYFPRCADRDPDPEKAPEKPVDAAGPVQEIKNHRRRKAHQQVQVVIIITESFYHGALD